MTLNASFSSSARPLRRRKLDGSDRGLDGMVGFVILIAELMIGSLVLTALYALGLETITSSADPEAVQAGFLISVVGSAVSVGATSISYLTRIIRGFRSWTAPLWGLVLMSAAVVVGYITMSGGL